MTLIDEITTSREPCTGHEGETREGTTAPDGGPEAFGTAVVDLGAIRDNTALLNGIAKGDVMAVVKANAFGHGAVPVARTALAAGATWLGVTSIREAVELRAAQIEAPILAWMHLPGDDLTPAVEGGIDLSVSSLQHLEALACAARALDATIDVHLKVDTGLHRAGEDLGAWERLIRRARLFESAGLVRVRGVWSHLARADEPSSGQTARQVRVFDAAVGEAKAAGLSPDVVHLANSAALLAYPETHYDLARIGIALYGVEPIPGRRHGLRPAMTLRARTLLRRRVPAGTAVAYGHEYVTDHATTLVLVPLGYADGVPRAAGGRAEVSIAGQRHPVAGRIAMDQFVVDAGGDAVDIGDEVVVFGSGEHGEPTVEDWAAWSGTIPHEVLTGIGDRVPRSYLPADGGRPRQRVAVVFGGTSAEHEVSCASGAAIVSALDPARYDVVPVLISRSGVWTVGADEARPPTDRWTSLHEAMRVLRTVDVVIPALHGPQGEDGTLQGMLATLGVPFVGSGVLASAVGMDKAVAKDLFRAHGLAVADGVVLTAADLTVSAADRERLGLPVFVKPARAGSSQGVTRVDSWADLAEAIEVARGFDPKVVVEQGVVGREVDVAVLEHPDGRLEAGPPLEISYAATEPHFSYAAKYGGEGTHFEIPAPLDPELAAELQRVAVEVFELLGCRGLLRVDFLLGDGRSTPVVNEVNTFPGFTALSQFPQIWAAAGLDYPALVDTLVQSAIRASASAAAR